MKYYSEKLNKLFDTEKDLVAAEQALAAEQAKKELAAQEKKAEAKAVEDAFKARNAARREYNTKLVEARKAYNSAIAAAKEVFNKTLTEATNAKDNAEEAYNTALKEFTSKHPEGYHMTLKDGDNVMTISNSADKQVENISKEYNEFLNSLLNIWKF
jgi:septal ring factor EnvC (AmiA/AmiB activator)